MAKTLGGPSARFFYGYWVVLALSVIGFLSAGIRFTIGPFLKPVAAELGIDRGTFSLVISPFLYGAFMPVVGRLVDRLGSWLGGVLFDVTGGCGAAFSVAGALRLIAAGLSITINEAARPAGRALTLPGRPHPVAGGR
jgi:predicted MFS family arabinose efflux permease